MHQKKGNTDILHFVKVEMKEVGESCSQALLSYEPHNTLLGHFCYAVALKLCYF